MPLDECLMACGSLSVTHRYFGQLPNRLLHVFRWDVGSFAVTTHYLFNGLSGIGFNSAAVLWRHGVPLPYAGRAAKMLLHWQCRMYSAK